ncbi:hypothetical protein ACQWHR_26730, partial [Salmonella enterica subsp. enterica serovar Infantis]
MYQPDFLTVPFRLGLYRVVDSVEWIERLLEAGVRTIPWRLRARRGGGGAAEGGAAGGGGRGGDGRGGRGGGGGG